MKVYIRPNEGLAYVIEDVAEVELRITDKELLDMDTKTRNVPEWRETFISFVRVSRQADVITEAEEILRKGGA